MAELDRVRWHCRRGLLELDLVLQRFSEQHLPYLAPDQLTAFQELLMFPDPELLDLVMGRSVVKERRYDYLVDLLRAA